MEWFIQLIIQLSRWIVLQNSLIDSSVLQEIFSSASKCLSWNGEKTDSDPPRSLAKTGSCSYYAQLW